MSAAGEMAARVRTAPHVPGAGVWCPAVTFFDAASDELDLDAQTRYFRHLALSGLRGLIVLGSNAEAFLLTREERVALVATARAAVGPDFPLMAGVGAHSTKQTLQFAADAARAGADYLLVLPPAYFGRTSGAVVEAFFATVAAAAPLPIVIYNFPGVCNGVDLDSETITRIVRASAAARPDGTSNVVGVKLTCGSVGKITRLAATFAADEFATFGGQSDFLIGGLAAGSAGCVAAFANVFPRLASAIYARYQKGDLHGAMELQRVAALAESPCKGGIAPTKYAVACYSARRAGIADAEAKLQPRHPYEPPGEAVKRDVRDKMSHAAEVERALYEDSSDVGRRAHADRAFYPSRL